MKTKNVKVELGGFGELLGREKARANKKDEDSVRRQEDEEKLDRLLLLRSPYGLLQEESLDQT